MTLSVVGVFTALCGLCGFQGLYVAADGPEYKFAVDKLTKEIDSRDILDTDLLFEKRDNEVNINGQLKLLVELDNDWKVNLVVWSAEEAEGTYTKVFEMPRIGVCAFMKMYYRMYFYQSLKNYSNAPAPNICPVPRNTYVLKDYPLDSSKISIILRPGYYRFIGSLWMDGEEKIRYIFEGRVYDGE